MTLQQHDKAKVIRDMNDRYRTTMVASPFFKPVYAGRLSQESYDIKNAVVNAAMGFKDFNKDNDPLGEHDFAFFDVVLPTGQKEKYFFKFDYYAKDMTYLSEDPTDNTKTVRILTLAHASDY